MDAGHLPAEDPHYGSVLRLHAGKEAGSVPVALLTEPHGWSHAGAGESGPLNSVELVSMTNVHNQCALTVHCERD